MSVCGREMFGWRCGGSLGEDASVRDSAAAGMRQSGELGNITKTMFKVKI